jgi:hypothetical protein
MNGKKLTVVMFAAALILLGAHAAQAAVEVRGVNVDEGYQKVVKYLLESEIQKRKGLERKDFTFNAVGYGDEVRGRLEMYDTADPKNTAKTELNFKKEELEIAIPRMVTAVTEDMEIEDTITSQNVTEGEAGAERYLESRKYWHAAIGGGIGLNGFNSEKQMMLVQGGYGHRWRRVSFEARSGFSFSPDGNSLNYNMLDIVGRYHFSDKNIAPFAGGMAGIHYMNRKVGGETILGISRREGRWGMAVGISGGVTFFRHLKVNLPVEAKYQHTFVNGLDANEMYLTVGLNF